MMPADKHGVRAHIGEWGTRGRETFETVPALLRRRGVQPRAFAGAVDIEDFYSILEPTIEPART